MIHFHITTDEARALSEGLGRLIAEGESNADGAHLTAGGKQQLRAHTQRLRVLQARLQLRLQAPAPAPEKVSKRGNPRKATRAALSALTDAEVGFTA